MKIPIRYSILLIYLALYIDIIKKKLIRKSSIIEMLQVFHHTILSHSIRLYFNKPHKRIYIYSSLSISDRECAAWQATFYTLHIGEPFVVHNQPNKLISCSFMNSKIADSINFIPVHRLACAAVSIISYLTCLAESLSLSLSLFLSLHREITRRDIRRARSISLFRRFVSFTALLAPR